MAAKPRLSFRHHTESSPVVQKYIPATHKDIVATSVQLLVSKLPGTSLNRRPSRVAARTLKIRDRSGHTSQVASSNI
ncbi:unnamed protein product [Periconia digitata]|uniref:Uncharacterized protein n=1 Tax=Periconia digitata TaxID=1303443 RepID=A0A9W4U851_9PLEO|nr:unnamed protein product [Periconia digitata]